MLTSCIISVEDCQTLTLYQRVAEDRRSMPSFQPSRRQVSACVSNAKPRQNTQSQHLPHPSTVGLHKQLRLLPASFLSKARESLRSDFLGPGRESVGPLWKKGWSAVNSTNGKTWKKGKRKRKKRSRSSLT